MPDMDWEKSLGGEPARDAGPGRRRRDRRARLRDAGVRHLFAINGGHTFPILGALRDNGVMLIHMRHEQACAYAADAYARASGGVGVCSVTAGCGLTNAVTGLAGAGADRQRGGLHRRPASRPPRTGIGSFQEAYGVEICALVRQVDERGCSTGRAHRLRPAPGVPRGAQRAAGRGAGRDPDQRPLPPGRSGPAAARRRGLRTRRRCARRPIRRRSSGRSTRCSAPSGR